VMAPAHVLPWTSTADPRALAITAGQAPGCGRTAGRL
jgi:hypothetical protein